MGSSNVRDHNHGITAYMVLAHQISKSGSWDHGKINYEIIGSYIFMLKDHGIIDFYDPKNLDHEKWFT